MFKIQNTLYACYIIGLSLLTGCAVNRVPVDLPPGEGGYLVVSLGQSGVAKNVSHHLNFRDMESKAKLSLHVVFDPAQADDPPIDFEAGRDAGAVIIRRIPVGNYELFGFTRSTWTLVGSDLARSIYLPKDNFSIPFRIQKGKVTYLGQFLSNGIAQTAPNSRADRSYYMVLTDEQKRDVAIARKKMAVPQEAEVIKQLADVKLVNHPLIRSSPLSMALTPK